MINLRAGQFRLENYALTIQPELTLSQFRSGDMPIMGENNFDTLNSSVRFVFEGRIANITARFEIYFNKEELRKFFWLPIGAERSDWADSENVKRWLANETGCSSPFVYEWGFVLTEPGEMDERPGVRVIFKSDFANASYVDMLSYYNERERYFDKLAKKNRTP